MKKLVYFVLASAAAAILWLIVGWLLPGVLGVGSLLALLAAANAPLLAPRLRTIELPGGVKLHFSSHDESAERAEPGLNHKSKSGDRAQPVGSKRRK